MSTTKVKIQMIGGVYRVNCHRTGQTRTVYDCKNCSKYISIDPVKAEIKCRED
jgi:hypothetical protein